MGAVLDAGLALGPGVGALATVAGAAPTARGVWQGVYWVYRLPVFIAYIAFVVTTLFWPAPKNLGHVIALSAAVLIGIQFWCADNGGVYVLWYLPFLLLLAFRPNLSAAQPSPARRIGSNGWDDAVCWCFCACCDGESQRESREQYLASRRDKACGSPGAAWRIQEMSTPLTLVIFGATGDLTAPNWLLRSIAWRTRAGCPTN